MSNYTLIIIVLIALLVMIGTSLSVKYKKNIEDSKQKEYEHDDIMHSFYVGGELESKCYFYMRTCSGYSFPTNTGILGVCSSYGKVHVNALTNFNGKLRKFEANILSSGQIMSEGARLSEYIGRFETEASGEPKFLFVRPIEEE